MKILTGSTLLYNNKGVKIYPITTIDSISIDDPIVIPPNPEIPDSGELTLDNLQDILQEIFDQLAKLKKDDEVVSSIQVKVEYCIYDSDKWEEVKEHVKDWSDKFIPPTLAKPYAWKHTKFTYVGEKPKEQEEEKPKELELRNIYEICDREIPILTLIIYLTSDNSKKPEIKYPILTNEEGKPIKPNGSIIESEDDSKYPKLTAFDTELPPGWFQTPIDVKPTTPYLYMSLRRMNDPKTVDEMMSLGYINFTNKWGQFSTPALIGTWAYDSKLEIRYKVTSIEDPIPIPTLDTNPGEGWTKDSITDFTGKLWMINATSVNGELLEDGGKKWLGPYLMGIIK